MNTSDTPRTDLICHLIDTNCIHVAASEIIKLERELNEAKAKLDAQSKASQELLQGYMGERDQLRTELESEKQMLDKQAKLLSELRAENDELKRQVEMLQRGNEACVDDSANIALAKENSRLWALCERLAGMVDHIGWPSVKHGDVIKGAEEAIAGFNEEKKRRNVP